MTGFHIGQKIVCIDAHCGGGFGDEIGPKLNAIYTVRELVNRFEVPAIYLNEIRNVPRPYTDGFAEGAFRSSAFRALEEKPDSIELSREIARGVSNGKPIIEDAEYRLPTPEKVRA